MRVDLWIVSKCGDGSHPDDFPNEWVWPRGADLSKYEPAGPWEPIDYNIGAHAFVWRRPCRKKQADLQRLANEGQGLTFPDVEALLRALVDLLASEEKP